MSRITQLISDLWISFGLFIILLIGIELTYRYLNTFKSKPLAFYHDTQLWHSRPYVMTTSKPNNSSYLGYPSQVPLEPKNKPRLFIIGGSTAAGIDTKKLSSALANRFEIYNFASLSSVSRQDYVKLTTEITTYKPDYILWLSGHNDFSGIDARPNYPQFYFIEDLNPLKAASSSHFSLIPMILLKSQIIRDHAPQILYSAFKIPINEINSALPYYGDLSLKSKALSQNISLMFQYCESINCIFIPILQPILNHKKTITGDEDKYLFPISSADYFFPAKIFEEQEKSPYLKQRLIHDFSPIYSDFTQELFIDTVHLTDHGYDILYEHISQIEDLQKTPKSRSELTSMDTFLNSLYNEHIFHGY